MLGVLVFCLFRCVFEEAFPADFAVEECFVFVDGEPNEDRTTYDVVFGNKAPIARVGRVVAVVAHHPIVVHGKCVAVGRLAVDNDDGVGHLQCMVFVGGDDALVERQVVYGELHRCAFLRHANGAEVVACPAVGSLEWENASAALFRFDHYFGDVVVLFELLSCFGCQWYVVDGF